MESNMSLFDLLKQAEENNVDPADIYTKFLTRKSNRLRKPLSIQLELLPLCNFRCGFCYVRKTKEEVESSGHRILRFEDWKWYIDESSRLGIAALTLTGGECMLHPDFQKIYSYAYEKGFQISLISNASCLTEEIFNLFEACPPSRISITLYGMSAETYKVITGNAAAFKTVVSNIKRLKARGLNVTLNYTASDDNLCDLEAALAFGRELNIAIFPTDALITSDNCNGIEFEKELAAHDRFHDIQTKHYSQVSDKTYDQLYDSYFSNFAKPVRHSDKGLKCSAGHSALFINWWGKMVPCVNFTTVEFDPRKDGFAESWEKIKAWADEVPLLEDCEGCIFINKCHLCPALHYGDMGEFGKVSPRLCFKKLYPEQAAKMQAKYEEMKANGEIE